MAGVEHDSGSGVPAERPNGRPLEYEPKNRTPANEPFARLAWLAIAVVFIAFALVGGVLYFRPGVLAPDLYVDPGKRRLRDLDKATRDFQAIVDSWNRYVGAHHGKVPPDPLEFLRQNSRGTAVDGLDWAVADPMPESIDPRNIRLSLADRVFWVRMRDRDETWVYLANGRWDKFRQLLPTTSPADAE